MVLSVSSGIALVVTKYVEDESYRKKIQKEKEKNKYDKMAGYKINALQFNSIQFSLYPFYLQTMTMKKKNK